jgi:hypothetical protein
VDVVVDEHGADWSNFWYVKRIAWVDQAFNDGGVRDRVREALRVYEASPRCECPHHVNLRAGRSA